MGGSEGLLDVSRRHLIAANWSYNCRSSTSKEDGETLVEYYAADGTAKSMRGNEISTGQWALVGETICFRYADEKEMECYRLDVMGNTVTFTDKSGTGSRYEIVKGNPQGL